MWTAELWGFDQYLSTDPSSLPVESQDMTYRSMLHNNDEPTPPSDLCRWYIHDRSTHFREFDSESEADFDPFDPDDDPAWEPWSPNERQASLQARLQNALEQNDFSTTTTTDLPVAIPAIAKAADEERSNVMLLESLGFSIMSRNIGQIEKARKRLNARKIRATSLYPFHLATSFLDASRSCCDPLTTLAITRPSSDFRETYLNDRGHTVLDNLMIAIIKSHTSARPIVVDDSLRDVAHFTGEEVDICGRWDADSPCIRQLYKIGHTSTPSSWKHKFCNTSIQVICHCISHTFYNLHYSKLLQAPSGLYVRRCFSTDCGKKLQLGPLHSLVMTAYHLATQGRDGEDLFGILACALCLIFQGLDPSIRADISVTALLSLDSFLECDHMELTAAELPEEVLAIPAFRAWNAKIKTGWIVLAGVLRRCEAADVEQVREEDNNPGSRPDVQFMGSTEPDENLRSAHRYVERYPRCFVRQKDLGTLWCSVQAELLSYRRVNERFGWTSKYFSMETLQEQLENDQCLVVGYAEHNLLKAHCACHSFGWWPLTALSEAIDPNVSNMDIPERAKHGGEIHY
jgi:hypothetical protein